jgi:malonyl-CoA decarboxylase
MQLPFLRWLRRRPHLPLEETITVAQRLIGRAGEAEGTKLANQLARNLEEFGTEDLTTFFTWLVTDLAPPHATLIGAASAYIADPTVENAALLTSAAEPPRQELLRRLNTARGGTALIVRLRAHLLKALRSIQASLRWTQI